MVEKSNENKGDDEMKETKGHDTCRFLMHTGRVCGKPCAEGVILCVEHQKALVAMDKATAIGVLERALKRKSERKKKQLVKIVKDHKDLTHVISYGFFLMDFFMTEFLDGDYQSDAISPLKMWRDVAMTYKRLGETITELMRVQEKFWPKKKKVGNITFSVPGAKRKTHILPPAGEVDDE